MRNKKKYVAILILLFLLLLLWIWKRPTPPEPPVPEQSTQKTLEPETPKPTKTEKQKQTDFSIDLEEGLDTSPSIQDTHAKADLAPQRADEKGLHKELIPKDIRIVRMYYELPVTGPDSVIRFNLNGTGFTNEFQKMIEVDPSALDIQVQNLKLVTTNQIQGEFVIGESALTAFVTPEVKIRSLPVFRAKEPFAVVRPGDVLAIQFSSLDETGRSGKFNVITNLSPQQFKQFRVESTHTDIEISSLVPDLPYTVEGVISLEKPVPLKAYGFTAYLGKRQIYSVQDEYRIVKPTIGKLGFVQSLQLDERNYRPGDRLDFVIQGSSLRPSDALGLEIEIQEGKKIPLQTIYLSASQIRAGFDLPKTLTENTYALKLLNPDGKMLTHKMNAFRIVPINWIRGVRSFPSASPGSSTQLRISGRAINAEYAQTLRLETEEKGLQISNLKWVSPELVSADLKIDPAVKAGDYVLELYSGAQLLSPPAGTVIQVKN